MSQQATPQHPAVVLRSTYRQLRALVVVALVAVIGLTVAVVILANDDSESSSASVPAQVGPLPSAENVAPDARYDGGPEEGTRGPAADTYHRAEILRSEALNLRYGLGD
jgi:hypothetical protein